MGHDRSAEVERETGERPFLEPLDARRDEDSGPDDLRDPEHREQVRGVPQAIRRLDEVRRTAQFLHARADHREREEPEERLVGAIEPHGRTASWRLERNRLAAADVRDPHASSQ